MKARTDRSLEESCALTESPAHEIKDPLTVKARAARALRASCRWAVTGTPIQNRLSELFSLLFFLRLHPYCDKKAFDRAIANPCFRGDQAGLETLRRLLGYIMLRRSKDVITLPDREDHRRFLKFSVQEQHAYDIAEKKAIECLEDALLSRKPEEGYRNALQKLTALRTICELGHLPNGTLQTDHLGSVGDGSLFISNVSDESTRPNKTDDNYRSKTDAFSTGDIVLGVYRPLAPLKHGRQTLHRRWPTKIQALVEELEACDQGTKR